MATTPKTSEFQHHVPKFYLKGWETSVNGLHRRVWVYEKEKAPRPSAIRRTGGRDNTYAVVKADGSTDLTTVEDYLKRLEDRTAKIFPTILRREPLSLVDKRTLTVFVSAFYRRDTYTFDNFVPEKLATTIPDLHKEMLEQANAVDATEDIKKYFRLAVDKAIDLASKNLNSVASQAILSSEPFADEFLGKLNWCFLLAQEGSFITSDCPVVFDRIRGMGNYANGHILFPISHSTVLWMTQWPILSNCYAKIPGALVNDINARIIVNAHEQVYANHNSPNIKDFVDKYISMHLPRVQRKAAGQVA